MTPLLEEHVSLRPHNTFGLEVRARYFARFASVGELRALLARPEVQAAEKLILGGGSNVLFTQDFPGVVLKNEIRGLEILSESSAARRRRRKLARPGRILARPAPERH